MMNRCLVALIAASLGLSGCQFFAPERGKPAVTKPPATSDATATTAPPTAPKPTAKKVPAPPAKPAPPEATPVALIGLSRPELTAALGAPTERADRNPGQSWVYRANGCTLEVLFLFDVVRNEMFVIDRKLGGTDGTPRGEQQCLQRIKAAHVG